MSFRRMIHAVETHSGEPMRVITGGVPHIPGESAVTVASGPVDLKDPWTGGIDSCPCAGEPAAASLNAASTRLVPSGA